MGGVDDQRPKALRRKSTDAPEKSEGPPAPILKVKGTIVMGGLVIKL
jgi:hypothetical protein